MDKVTTNYLANLISVKNYLVASSKDPLYDEPRKRDLRKKAALIDEEIQFILDENEKMGLLGAKTQFNYE